MGLNVEEYVLIGWALKYDEDIQDLIDGNEIVVREEICGRNRREVMMLADFATLDS